MQYGVIDHSTLPCRSHISRRSYNPPRHFPRAHMSSDGDSGPKSPTWCLLSRANGSQGGRPWIVEFVLAGQLPRNRPQSHQVTVNKRVLTCPNVPTTGICLRSVALTPTTPKSALEKVLEARIARSLIVQMSPPLASVFLLWPSHPSHPRVPWRTC